MAKFGFDERALFFLEKAGLENLSGTPADAQAGDMLVYIKSDHLFIKKPSISEVLIVEDAVNLGADPGDPDGAQIFVQKNSSAQLEFRTLRSTTGTVNFDATSDANFVDINVDLTDINDELDHGALLGLADDDHLQYLLLAGRAGGQVANGGTAANDDLELKSTANATKGEVKVIDGSIFRHGDLRWDQKTQQTTDATPTNITVLTLLDDTAYNAEIIVVARRSDGGAESRASWRLEACAFRAAAGSATIQGPQKQHFKTSATAGLDVNFNVTGNDLRVDVTGLAAETYEWKIHCRYLESD